MSALSDPIRRWARYQRELGTDEVVLDAPLALPSAPERPAPGRPALRSAPGAPTASRPEAPPRNSPPANIPPPVSAARTATTSPAPRTAPPSRSAIPTFQNLDELVAHAQGCTRCVLCGRRRSNLATGGPERAPWAILTLYAWGEDAPRGGILAGDYAAPLLALAREQGLPDPAVAAIFACTPDDPADTTIQGFTEAVRCRGHWLQRLKLSGARAVLVLDHKATSLSRGPSGAVEWPAFRGRRWDLDGIPAVSTHHPSRLARNEALRPEVESDLRQILSIVGNA